MKKNEYNKWYLVLAIFAIIFTFFGGSLAYWQWTTNTAERTSIALTVTEDFRCDADGGGDITSGEKYLVPTDCTNEDYAIQRTITVAPKVFTNGLNIDFQLQLKINSIDSGLRNSKNFKYALTTNPNSCTSGVVESGTFYGLSANKTVDIFKNIYTSTLTEQYYLYIWLDKAETNSNTMNQNFSLSLTGSCSNVPEVEPQEPVLDPGMIPVTISNTGVVTTISEDSDDWYDYSNKEWANVVLVDSDSRSTYLNTTGTTVNQDDILAYYVWIPRYKYRIKDNMTCSELENPTVYGNPECYTYSMLDSNSDGSTDDEKELFIEFWYNNENGWLQDEFGLTYTMEEATEDVETMLSTGSVYIEQEDNSYVFTAILSWYNDDNDPDITYTSTFKDNNLVTGPRPIDISFEPKIAQVNNGDAVDTYYTHPAFIWDGDVISGIWVGKFESSADSTSDCYMYGSDTYCDNIDQIPRILPNVSALRNQKVSNQFITSLKFAGGTLTDGNVTFAGSDTYGLTTNSDSHMMKNSEWGATAYLSHSKYGTNKGIYMNNSTDYYTGCGALEEDNFIVTENECQIAYGGVSDGDYPQSTTGNITGIFDMSGGATEYVMGVLSDIDGNPRAQFSGFNGVRYNSTITDGILFPESKYYDLYLESQFSGNSETNITFCTLELCGGYALYETVNWYNDLVEFVNPQFPWFFRSGLSNHDVSVGVFYSGYGGGNSAYGVSWRSVLVVGT